MKAKIILAAIMLSCLASNAQFKLKKHIAPGILVLVSGGFEGAMDALQFRYDGFKRVFPNANDQFFDPRISWKNKWKGGDPANGKTFAGKVFVASTDAWHGFKFGRNVTMFSAFAIRITGEKRKWYVYVIEAAAYYAINRVGFNIAYKTLGY